MKILSAEQIREADKITIEKQGIPSIDLMERAAEGLAKAITSIAEPTYPVDIFCGKGNNGGDGLALARLLIQGGFEVNVWVIGNNEGGSKDFRENLKRLNKLKTITFIEDEHDFPEVSSDSLVVDSILGSGLNRPLEGLIDAIVGRINQLPNKKISVDIPTGLFADDNSENDLEKVLRADITLSFQIPKLSFFSRNTAPLTGSFQIIDIGLDKEFIHKAATSYYHFTKADAQEIFIARKEFSYKGTYGHALMIAGGEGKYGAAMLAAKSCMRSGSGLLTVCLPKEGVNVLHTYLPEAMAIAGGDNVVNELPNLKPYSAVGLGPGIGQKPETARLLKKVIQSTTSSLVLDADALNILSDNRTWLSFLPPKTILTPHIGEFRRLLGVEELRDNYLQQLSVFSQKNQVITILKDAITTVATPAGQMFFIKEGSPALATAGSGDVLTGLITGLLSSGYGSERAALLGVYLHARAGKLAGEKYSLESVLAGDVITNIASAFRELY